MLPHLRPVLTGPQAWDADQTIRRAIEIRDGIIRNPRILSFQHRAPDYPHPPRAAGTPSRPRLALTSQQITQGVYPRPAGWHGWRPNQGRGYARGHLESVIPGTGTM